MARASHEVKVRLSAEDRASATIAKTESRFGKLAKSIKTGFLVVAAAATAAGYALAKSLSAVVSAATEQEDAVTKLDASLASLGPTAAGVSERLQEQAAALQKVTKFGDEAIIAGQALIASFTKDEEAIKSATEAALNMSAATGQNLTSAFLLMGKAAKGETSTLSRYGIVLDEGLGKSEKFAAAIAAINEQWGGQAAAQAKTYSGLVQQISNAYGDLKEKLGFAITQNEKITDSLTKLRDLLTSGGLVDAVKRLAEVTATAASKTADFGVAAVETVRGLAVYNTRVKELETTYSTLPRWLDINKIQLEALRFVYAGTVKPIADLISYSQQYFQELGKGAGVADATRKIQDQMAESFQASVTKILAAQDAVRGYGESIDELRQKQSDAIAESDAYHDKLKELGIVLDTNVNAKIAENNRFLDEQRERFRYGEISADDYERSVTRVAIANERLRDSLKDGTDALSDARDGFDDAASGADGYGRSLDALPDRIRRVSEAEQAAARARQSSDTMGGTMFGGSKLFPNSSIANTAIRNGQRVRVYPNGQRSQYR